MTEKISYVQPYGPDNTLNPFGDYDRLSYRAERENGSVTVRKWELLSSRGLPPLELNLEQIRNVLTCLFLANAAVTRSND